MRLHIYQSADGDCLLLESKDRHLILCDGGPAGSMRDVVRAELAKFRKRKRKIDYVYVSHVDNDHITGVLQLLEDELEWRVHDHHKQAGHTGLRKPAVPRPPEIGGLWHNAFSDQLGENTETVADMLAASVPVMLATNVGRLTDQGEEYYQIATAVKEGIRVSRLASAAMLGIPRNRLPGSNKDAKLLLAGHGTQQFKVGGEMTLTIIGPTAKELEELRQGWNNWLTENEEAVKKLDAELKKRMEEFANSAAAGQISLSDWNGMPGFKGVSTPNIASLMFMVEEDGKRLILTGDSQQKIITDGLEAAGFLGDQGLHVDVLKVQHHGSEHNMDAEFAQKVSADHYVFCGNGKSSNPELAVIRLIFESRLGPQAVRSIAPDAAGRPFKFWFSTSSGSQAKPEFKDHMQRVEDLVDDLAQQSDGMFTFHFNEDPFTTLRI